METNAVTNRIDVFHQVFDNGQINDSIDWDSLLIPDINQKLNESKLNRRQKKMVSDLVTKEVDERD